MKSPDVPIVSRLTYVIVWLALLACLALNWGLARLDLGHFNLVASLAVAFVQTLLMLLFLMHVRQSSPLIRLGAVIGFFWLLIMFDLTLGDYLTRGAVPDSLRGSWKHGAWPALTNDLPSTSLMSPTRSAKRP